MPATERQIAANRANALRSTGPITEAGKSASRVNALRHGMAAETLVLAVAGEDQAAVDAEREAWVGELAPRGQVAARLAERAFRAFVRLQRCDRSEDAATDDRTRRAEADWEVRRAEEVREAIDELGSAPSVAVARLMSTAEGADWMRSAWEVLAFNLAGGTWNRDDYDRAVNLLGIEEVGHLELLRWTDAIVGLREMRRDIRQQGIDPDLADDLAEHYTDEFVAEARATREAADSAVAALSTFIAARATDLASLADALRPESARSRSLAEARALFDDTSEGKLRRRYAAEAEREMHRNLKAAQMLAKPTPARPAAVPEPKAEPLPSRNEPNSRPPPHRPRPPRRPSPTPTQRSTLMRHPRSPRSRPSLLPAEPPPAVPAALAQIAVRAVIVPGVETKLLQREVGGVAPRRSAVGHLERLGDACNSLHLLRSHECGGRATRRKHSAKFSKNCCKFGLSLC